MPVTEARAAVRRPTAIAIASSSSSEQRWHRGPGAKPVAAGGPRERLHRVAEVAQPLDVATDRPPGHLEPVGQLGARPVTAPLEQREQLQKPARGLGS